MRTIIIPGKSHLGLEDIEESLRRRYAGKYEVTTLESDLHSAKLKWLIRKNYLTGVLVSAEQAADHRITATVQAIHPVVAKHAKVLIPLTRTFWAFAFPAFFFTWWRKMEEELENL